MSCLYCERKLGVWMILKHNPYRSSSLKEIENIASHSHMLKMCGEIFLNTKLFIQLQARPSHLMVQANHSHFFPLRLTLSSLRISMHRFTTIS
mgnify:CR=1 FL=1